jgi:hypothetical protein
MRNFAYKNPDFIKNEVVPELIEDNPCYQQSVYDSVMYDETPDGDLIQVDMTQILLNQEKYRCLLGDMNVQNILAQMHPTQSTFMDDMTDEERFNCVISRHCQTMSEPVPAELRATVVPEVLTRTEPVPAGLGATR